MPGNPDCGGVEYRIYAIPSTASDRDYSRGGPGGSFAFLGGGVMLTVPSMAESLTERIRAHATMMSRDLRVLRAALGDSAGIFGAADRVWRQE